LFSKWDNFKKKEKEVGTFILHQFHRLFFP
jgi:hypothetical protein